MINQGIAAYMLMANQSFRIYCMLMSLHGVLSLLSKLSMLDVTPPTVSMEDGVNMTANSLYPGMIVTNLFRHSNIVTGNYFTFLLISA
uniref:Uncharacterized protein n=1 Tax=Vitis vinifera TaxID=29760 RepID=F6H6K6_VITVI